MIKQSLTNAPVLALYDPNRYTVLKTDASSYGLGCALFQKQDDGDMKPVSFDMLSRNPVIHSLTLEEEQHSSNTENYVDMVIRHLPATDLRLQEIREKQSQDVICQTLANYCNNGWPETKHKASEIGKVYWHLRGEITINKGLSMKAADYLFLQK